MKTPGQGGALSRTFIRLTSRWPWRRQGSRDQLVIAWSGGSLAYVLARPLADGVHAIVQCGVERQGADSMDTFVLRLQALGIKGCAVHVMLWAEQYQCLQIDAPAVAPEEMRAAARYQVHELLHTHADDATLDVMRVGDGRQMGGGQIFVVAVANTVVRELIALGDAVQWEISVIDIQETAQRNLQSALARRDGYPDSANAALILVSGHLAVLTICANDELFYSRRLELPEGLLASYWGAAGEMPITTDSTPESYSPVSEYVPDYRVGGVAHGSDYSESPQGAHASSSNGAAIDEKVQRFLTEVERSLDAWSRSWSSMPLHEMRVHVAGRTADLCAWFGAALAQEVRPLAVETLFPGFEGTAGEDAELCLPLLGVLLRSETRNA